MDVVVWGWCVSVLYTVVMLVVWIREHRRFWRDLTLDNLERAQRAEYLTYIGVGVQWLFVAVINLL